MNNDSSGRSLLKARSHVLQIRLGREQMDAWLSQWGCTLGGIGLCGIAIVTIRQHATGPIEFFIGAAAAVVTCLILFLLGALSRQVHLAVGECRAPWRARRWELLAHGIGLALLGLGGRMLVNAMQDLEGALTGGLLLLAAYATILCLGCWSTLYHPCCASSAILPKARM